MSSPSPPPPTGRSRASRIVTATLLGLLFATVGAEVLLRTVLIEEGMFRGRRPLPPFGAITNPRQRTWAEQWREHLASGTTPADIGGFSLYLGWDMHASARSADGRYRTNALAARGPREYLPAPPPGVLRLACFGDSFTFCDEVSDDATWQSQLERDHPAIEAVNFGVGGYGTDQALLRYRALRDRVADPVITIGMMLENIGRNVNRYRPLYYPQTGVAYAKPRFVLQDDARLRLLQLPFTSFRDYIDSVLDGSVLDELRRHEFWSGPNPWGGEKLAMLRLWSAFEAYRARDHRRLWEDPAGEAFQVTVALLETFHREAIAHGAASAPVLIFPAESDLDALLAEEHAYWELLLRALDERGIPYLDLAQPLAKACREQARSASSSYVGGHLNPDANGVVAAYLADWLAEQLPAELVPSLGR